MSKEIRDGFYPKKVMSAVKAKNDIVSVISDFTKVEQRDGYYIGICPFHKGEAMSLAISKEKQVFQCLDCGANGDVYSFVMQIKGASLNEAVEFLANRAGISLPPLEENTIGKKERETTLSINKEAALFYYQNLIGPKGSKAVAYLQGRGLSRPIIKRFGLGFAGEYSRGLYEHLKQKGFEDSAIEQSGLVSFYGGKGYDKFRNRVMCPIVDRDGNVIGFSGRVIDHNSTPKYMNSPETLAFDKRRNLYGLNLAQKTERASMILCEGNLDVIALHQAGFDNAVASLGTAFSAEHAAVLSQYTDRVDLVFDSDEAGIKATLRAIPILRSAGITPAIVHVEPHKDPDEFIKNEGAKEFQARLDSAEDSYRFEIRTLYGKYDFNDPDQKREAVKEFASQMLDAHEADRPAYYKAMGDLIDQYDGMAQQGREVMSPKFPAEEPDPISVVDTNSNSAQDIEQANEAADHNVPDLSWTEDFEIL